MDLPLSICYDHYYTVLKNIPFISQVCLPGDDSEKKLIFVAPHGLLFNEVSASAIMKVDQDGNVVDAGKSNLGMSQSVFDLHATIHAARRDANCVMFLCPESVMVVSFVFRLRSSVVNELYIPAH